MKPKKSSSWIAIKHHQQTLQDQLKLKQELLNQKEIAAHLSQEFQERKSHEINEKKIAIERLRAEKDHLKKHSKIRKLSQTRTQESITKALEEISQASKKIPETITDFTHSKNSLKNAKNIISGGSPKQI